MSITKLQCQILSVLGSGECSGAEVREELNKVFKVKRSLGAHYQSMSRLEDASFVEGRYEEKVIDGYHVKERFYKMTGQGEVALREAIIEFEQIKSAAGELGYA